MLQTLPLAAGLLTIWAIVTVTYRFFFHPLAHIPGPPLAIASYLYEWYYDIVLGGQYTFKLKELHKVYGPIIRINPDEIHINDVEYTEQLFGTVNGKADKPARLASVFGPTPTIIATIDHDLHRVRKGALQPFFSRRSIVELVPYVQDIVQKLCDRLAQAQKTGDLLNMKHFYAAFTLDVMNEYCFSKDSNTVNMTDFGKDNYETIQSLLETSIINIHFPWLIRIVLSIPDNMVKLVSPGMAQSIRDRQRLSKQIEAIRHGKELSHQGSGHRTIFHDLLESKLPPEELKEARLREEGYNLVAAGSETTATVLRNTSYHIAANPEVRRRLQEELTKVMPLPTSDATLQDLEKLPYLTAVIHEGLRITNAVLHRNSRSFQDKALVYDGKVIPPKTVVHMTALFVNSDENLFPDPNTFQPERWFASNHQELQRSVVVFGRGPRACLGTNLAWAELYLVLAHVFRRFNFDISAVVRERDVDMTRDLVLGGNSSKSPGLMVKVLSA